MLWAAGQRRVVREERDRLAETYIAVRDAYVAGNVAIGRVKSKRNSHVPSYAQPDAETRRRQAKLGLAQLKTDFPGHVAGTPEFRN